MDIDLKAISVPPKEEGDPTSIVFMLHGYGSSAREIINNVSAWNKKFNRTLFLGIEAPFPCEAAPEKDTIHQWFSMANPTHANLWEGVNRVTPAINKFIDRVLEFQNIPANKSVLFGFCQGATVAMNVAMSRVQPLGGVVALSGAIIPPLPGIEVKMPPTDFLLSHGEEDPLVPIAAMDQAKKVLDALGNNVKINVCPECGHHMDDRSLGVTSDFFTRKF